MSAQTSYNQKMSHGVAGGLYDLTDHVVDTRTVEASGDGVIRFGLGVVEGTDKGKQVKLPVAASTKAKFEGVVLNSHTHEMDMKGDVKVRDKETVGVIRNGRVYVRIAAEVEPAYGDALYLITSGDEAGYFTNTAATSTDEFKTVKVTGHFIGAKATDAIAPVYIKVDKE